jgi:hypothetical protein
MMLNLEVESASEPIIEQAGRDIASRACLEANKMGGVMFLRCEDLHRVMTNGEDHADEETTKALGESGEDEDFSCGRESRNECDVRQMVNGEAGDLGGVHAITRDLWVTREQLVLD